MTTILYCFYNLWALYLNQVCTNWISIVLFILKCPFTLEMTAIKLVIIDVHKTTAELYYQSFGPVNDLWNPHVYALLYKHVIITKNDIKLWNMYKDINKDDVPGAGLISHDNDEHRHGQRALRHYGPWGYSQSECIHNTFSRLSLNFRNRVTFDLGGRDRLPKTRTVYSDLKISENFI